MNFADFCVNEQQLRICTNRKNIHYNAYNSFFKLTFKYVINVCYYFHNMLVTFILVFLTFSTSNAWFPALRFCSSVTVSPGYVSKIRKNYVYP